MTRIILLAIAVLAIATPAALAGPTGDRLADPGGGGPGPSGVISGSPCDPVADAHRYPDCWWKMSDGTWCPGICRCRFLFIPGVGVIAIWEPTSYGGNG